MYAHIFLVYGTFGNGGVDGDCVMLKTFGRKSMVIVYVLKMWVFLVVMLRCINRIIGIVTNSSIFVDLFGQI